MIRSGFKPKTLAQANKIAAARTYMRRKGIKRGYFHPTAPEPDSRRDLEHRLDAATSMIVRLSSPACVLCGCSDWQMLTNGHLFKRGHRATRYDYQEGGNCHTLCKVCNDRDNREAARYRRWFVAKYGAEQFAELEARARLTEKFTDDELREMLMERERVLEAMVSSSDIEVAAA